MRAAAVIAIVLAIGCTKTDNALPPEAWGVSDYVAAGVPDPGHRWSNDESLRAFRILAEVSASDPGRLPRLGGARSGPVFARLLEPAIEDPKATIGERFLLHGQRHEEINKLSKRYVENALAAPTREWIELMGVLLRGSVAMAPLLEPFLASFGPEDPKAEVRRGGLAKIRSGWGGMLLGGIAIAGDTRVAEADRIVMIERILPTLPVLVPQLAADKRDAIRELADRLVSSLPAGALHDKLVTARSLIAPGAP